MSDTELQAAAETGAAEVDPTDADGDDSIHHKPDLGNTPAAAAAPAAAAPTPPPTAETATSSAAPGQDDAEQDAEPAAPMNEGQLDLEIARLAAVVKEADDRVTEATAGRKAAIAARDAVIEEKYRRFPPPTPAQSIQAHVAREKARREARVAAATAMNEAVGARVAPTKSPLDAAIGGRRKPQTLIPQRGRKS